MFKLSSWTPPLFKRLTCKVLGHKWVHHKIINKFREDTGQWDGMLYCTRCLLTEDEVIKRFEEVAKK